MPLLPGSSLGPYRIEAHAGSGGMGEVYKARDTRLDRTVAIKVLPAPVASNPDLRQRFEREARTVAALNHPHICALYDIGRDGETDFLVLEYLDGETLEARLARGPLPPMELLRLGREVAEGMEAAHRAGLVHRDLKPANVIITRAGTKIVDFGVAKDVKAQSRFEADEALTKQTRLTRAGVLVGTLPYMAPEQLEGRPADVRTDIWALGCLLYETATAERPFPAETEAGLITAIMSAPAVPPTRRNPLVPSRLDWVIQRCLEKDPERRWQSSRDVAIELEALERADPSTPPAHVEDANTPAVVPTERIGVAIATDRLLGRRLWIGAALLVPIVALGLGVAYQQRRLSQERQRVERVEWARQEALPQVIRHIEAREYADAFELATQAEAVIPGDVVLRGLWNQMSNGISIETDPPGANVSLRANRAGDAEWRLAGQSPITGYRVPLGAYRLRVEKEGFESRELLLSLSYPQTDGGFKPLPSFSTPEVRNHISLRLDPEGTAPPGMIAVDGGNYLVPLTGFPVQPVMLERYFIDRSEVTNAAFKEFVDAGGYTKREYWQHEFRQGTRVLDWQEAMALFLDTTGRPGPAGWELGRFASGLGDYPVGGVSWFEAAAYAVFRGKELPTVYHWIRAALPSGEHTLSLAPEIVPSSNFGGDGPARVGSFAGIGVSGAVDLAGNLREWCWNESRGGRVALGGAWSDPTYAFTSPVRPSPFDRSLVNGFRLMKERDTRGSPELRAGVATTDIDFSAVKAISDEAFAKNKGYFGYSPTPPAAKVESRDESAPDWRREHISIDAAYGRERFKIHIDLPKAALPPYQAVVYFPGSNALEQATFEDAYWEGFDYIARSGRALIRPELAGMYERSNRPATLSFKSTQERARAYIQDLGRTLDYLETRDDIDISRVAYMGLSLGSVWAPIILAYEDRFKVAVLITGGVVAEPPAAAAPRVKVPVLLLGGRYDYMIPLETTQRPLMKLLGTPDADKRHVIFEAGHLPLPRAEVIRETLAWLDRYQGRGPR